MKKTVETTAWVIGNWKMNPATVNEAKALLDDITLGLLKQDDNTQVKVGIAPSMFHLGQLISTDQDMQSNGNATVHMFAQDISAAQDPTGAYTGDVSTHMLAHHNIAGSLVGHSERRAYQKESDSTLSNKLINLLNQDMLAIFCVGESKQEREAGCAQAIVAKQLDVLFNACSVSNLATEKLAKQILIAYEPVWAIGTGLSASSEDAQNMHTFIRQTLKQHDVSLVDIPLLYGGSVKPENAADFAAIDDVNGVLVGGASLKAQQFLDIVHSFR